MRASIFFIILCAGSYFPAAAQSVSHHVVAPAGDVDRNDRFELAWTIGEVAVSSRINQQESFTEGFHQPVIRVEALTDDVLPTQEQPDIAVYPNPVSQQLQVQFELPVSTTWMITMTAVDGSRLSQQTFRAGNTHASLDVSTLPAGIYFLHLRSDDDAHMRNYKISKIQ